MSFILCFAAGHSAGTAAAMLTRGCTSKGPTCVNSSKLDLTALHAALLADGQQLSVAPAGPHHSPPPVPPAPKLEPNQWLALKQFFTIANSGGKITMKVTSGPDPTYLKKSEQKGSTLPPSMRKTVHQGQTFDLTKSPSTYDIYWIVTLA